EPEGDARRWAKATSAVAETLITAMKPGARIKELQALARATYQKAGVPDPDRTIVFFHGLGLSHMELELPSPSAWHRLLARHRPPSSCRHPSSRDRWCRGSRTCRACPLRPRCPRIRLRA